MIYAQLLTSYRGSNKATGKSFENLKPSHRGEPNIFVC